MNIGLIAFVFSASILLSQGLYAQNDIEIDYSKSPYFYSLKKAKRNKEKAYKLDLSNADLKEFPIEILELSELRYLILDSNHINEIPEAIHLLEKLEVLSISNNEIASIPTTISKLQNLLYFNVGNNQIANLPLELFSLYELRTLVVNNNNLSSFPSYFMKLKELRSIFAANNKIENIPDEIGHLYNLKTLSLSNNRLKELPNRFFELSQLEFLYLYENQLSQIDAEIHKLKELKKIHLGSNQLIDLPVEIGKLYNLKELYLNDNALESFPIEVNSFINLSTLSLSNNSIASLPTDLVKLKKLELLYLEGYIFKPFPQLLYDLQNKGVEIKGLTTKELYQLKLLTSKARNKKLIENYEEAIEKYNEILLLDTNNIQLMSELASCHLEKGNFDLAQTICEKALAKNPESQLKQEIQIILDNSQSKTNKNTALNQEYEERYNKDPSDISPYLELGKKYFNLKKYDQAAVNFQKVITQEPSSPDAHFYTAVISLIQEEKALFIFSTIRYLTLEQKGNKALTIIPFLFSKMNMKVGVKGEDGSFVYYDSYIIRDDNGKIIYQSESNTADLLTAMLSELNLSDSDSKDSLNTDTLLDEIVQDALKINKNNVEVFKSELKSICASAEQEGDDFMNYYLPFYKDLITNEQLETLAYLINNIRYGKEEYIEQWIKDNPNKVDEFYKWSKDYGWDTHSTSPKQ